MTTIFSHELILTHLKQSRASKFSDNLKQNQATVMFNRVFILHNLKVQWCHQDMKTEQSKLHVSYFHAATSKRFKQPLE